MPIVRSADKNNNMVVESNKYVRVLDHDEVRPVFGPAVAETGLVKAKAQPQLQLVLSHHPPSSPPPPPPLSAPSSSSLNVSVAFRARNSPFMGLWPRHGSSNPSFTFADGDLGTDTVPLTSLRSNHVDAADEHIDIFLRVKQKDRIDRAFTYEAESTDRVGPNSTCPAQSSSHSLPDSVLSCEETHDQSAHGHDAGSDTNSHDNVIDNAFTPPNFDDGYEGARASEVSEADTPPLTPMSPRQHFFKPRSYVSADFDDEHDDSGHHGENKVTAQSSAAGFPDQPAETDALLAVPSTSAWVPMAILPLPVTASDARMAPPMSFTRLESFVHALAVLITSALITLSIYLTLADIRM